MFPREAYRLLLLLLSLCSCNGLASEGSSLRYFSKHRPAKSATATKAENAHTMITEHTTVSHGIIPRRALQTVPTQLCPYMTGVGDTIETLGAHGSHSSICDPFLATVTPQDGCDCYNFCGGKYIGCCTRGQDDCLLDLQQCPSDEAEELVLPTIDELLINGDLVVGCQFQNVPSMVDQHDGYQDATRSSGTTTSSMAAVDAENEIGCKTYDLDGSKVFIAPGQSFGKLLTTPCGSPEQYPCFCGLADPGDEQMANSEPQYQIKCPYCPFQTMEGETVCGVDGHTIQFLDTHGVEQTCSCDYLSGSNSIATSCEASGTAEPTPTPAPTEAPHWSNDEKPTREPREMLQETKFDSVVMYLSPYSVDDLLEGDRKEVWEYITASHINLQLLMDDSSVSMIRVLVTVATQEIVSASVRFTDTDNDSGIYDGVTITKRENDLTTRTIRRLKVVFQVRILYLAVKPLPLLEMERLLNDCWDSQNNRDTYVHSLQLTLPEEFEGAYSLTIDLLGANGTTVDDPINPWEGQDSDFPFQPNALVGESKKSSSSKFGNCAVAVTISIGFCLLSMALSMYL